MFDLQASPASPSVCTSHLLPALALDLGLPYYPPTHCFFTQHCTAPHHTIWRCLATYNFQGPQETRSTNISEDIMSGKGVGLKLPLCLHIFFGFLYHLPPLLFKSPIVIFCSMLTILTASTSFSCSNLNSFLYKLTFAPVA